MTLLDPYIGDFKKMLDSTVKPIYADTIPLGMFGKDLGNALTAAGTTLFNGIDLSSMGLIQAQAESTPYCLSSYKNPIDVDAGLLIGSEGITAFPNGYTSLCDAIIQINDNFPGWLISQETQPTIPWYIDRGFDQTGINVASSLIGLDWDSQKSCFASISDIVVNLVEANGISPLIGLGLDDTQPYRFILNTLTKDPAEIINISGYFASYGSNVLDAGIDTTWLHAHLGQNNRVLLSQGNSDLLGSANLQCRHGVFTVFDLEDFPSYLSRDVPSIRHERSDTPTQSIVQELKSALSTSDRCESIIVIFVDHLIINGNVISHHYDHAAVVVHGSVHTGGGNFIGRDKRN